MLLSSLFVGGTFLVRHALAQTTTYCSPGVPPAQPVAGNYTRAYRLQVHVSPPQDFMNDPNALFLDADGLWHLYYQYNPTAAVAGNQHSGRATSPDLYHWENQEIALCPPNSTSYVYVGSAVVDVEWLLSGSERNGTWTISVVIDRSIFEGFVNGGEQSGTMTLYGTQPLDTMRLAAAAWARRRQCRPQFGAWRMHGKCRRMLTARSWAM